jgi:hypothetical protein
MLSWLRKKFSRAEPKEAPKESSELLIWGVLHGPFSAKEIPDCEYPEETVMLVVKLSEGKKVFNAEFWFDNLDEAYVIINHFKDKIEPLKLNSKEFGHDR